MGLGLLLGLGGCPRGRSGAQPRYLGDDTGLGAVAPGDLDPELARRWEKLQQAFSADPQSTEIVSLADAVLESEPPLAVWLEAVHTKAAHHYLRGDDEQAASLAATALAEVPARTEPTAVVLELQRTWVRALVRGGSASEGLNALADPTIEGLFEEPERRGLRAVAYDRAGRGAEAAAAFAAWRAVVPDDGVDAAYAADRLATLAGSLDADSLSTAAASVEHLGARACLLAAAGLEAPGSETPQWVQDCAVAPPQIGVLLPRTGPWSALADPQLAAASIATVTLGVETGLRWRDPGSTPASAARAAAALVADGADVIVGPVGPANVRAVADAVGDDTRIIVPGEPIDDVEGVAPTLERRLSALVKAARRQGAERFLVAAPDNGYGQRAVKSIRASLEKSERKALIVQFYPPSTTSFAPVLAPLFPALGRKTALLVPDHLRRVELLLRQLTRSARPASQTAAEGLLVLSTAEGSEPKTVRAMGAALEHLYVCPAAVVGKGAEAFGDAYQASQGEPPGDQALLVFYALQSALVARSTKPRARVRRVEEGELVPPG